MCMCPEETKTATMSDLLLQWFSCCSFQHHPHQSSQSSASRRRHRHHHLKIDRSMIGSPTNFVHTGHIGSADVELSTSHLQAIQKQMESKGGYGRVQVIIGTFLYSNVVLILLFCSFQAYWLIVQMEEGTIIYSVHTMVISCSVTLIN